MDPRTLHFLVDDFVWASLGSHEANDSGLKVNPKRFGAYFPSKASLDTKLADDDSTWEYYAPVASPSRTSSSNSTSTCYTAYSSPAQEIASRFRAGLSLEQSDRASSPDSEDSEDVAWDVSSRDASSISDYELSVMADAELKALYRQSRFDALQVAGIEALAVMQSCGLAEQDQLVCQRPGCRDTVQNIKGLMYHLHIHNISDEDNLCNTCLHQFDDAQQFAKHTCTQNIRSPPISPLRESFRRALTKIISRH